MHGRGGIAKLYSLEREFAETRGGRILEVWKLFQGCIFGRPWMMTLDEVANGLAITVEEANAAAAEVTEAVVSLWHATPEYKASPYRVMHERRARSSKADEFRQWRTTPKGKLSSRFGC